MCKKLEDKLWTWNHCGEKISTLKGRLGFKDSDVLSFLKFRLSLEDGEIFDELKRRKVSEHTKKAIYCILYGYAGAKHVPETSTLTSFRNLSGGRIYFTVYNQRVINPLVRVFGENPQRLVEAAEILGGKRLKLADYSVKVKALPLVPLTFLLRQATDEFSASANVLYDSSVVHYLSTEQTVMLAELTVKRLKDAVSS
jgi:hypothetical protein